ncbi:MAG TPA: FIST N-terminal domain-containing protein [Thermoanaerobaculia bacterium]|nr:FIST N-terminal domain-containing protein [Thermoanaerobaculia bacterium]
MTESATAYTNETDNVLAGRQLGERLQAQLSGPPDAVILFASSRYDYELLLGSLTESCKPGVLVGCSSAGEFVSGQQGEGAASAVALRSKNMQFTASVGRNLHESRKNAAAELAASFRGVTDHQFPHRAALLLADALAGYTDELIEELSLQTSGNYRFFGGGAGDDAKFSKTHVFCGTKAYTDAVVALEMLSRKQIGIGVSHGWKSSGEPLRVTEVEGMRLISLNAAPAVEAFEEHAEKTGQTFDRSNPIPFFLHNVLGIDTGSGFKLRVPLAVNEDGSIACASDIPDGATLRIMSTSSASASEAAVAATTSALKQLGDDTPQVALFFDCVATRLRMGKEFGDEMNALQQTLGDIPFAGCNTYGQIARSEGQFSGFHNCTATVAVIPE